MGTMVAAVLLYLATTLILVKMSVTIKHQDTDDEEENCLVSLVIPSEKIKSSCAEKSLSHHKMQALVREITDLQNEINDLNFRLTGLLARDDNGKSIEKIKEELEKIKTEQFMTVEKRLSVLEEDNSQTRTYGITRKRLRRVLEPMLKSELDDRKEEIKSEIIKDILREYDITPKQSYGKPNTGDIFQNKVKSDVEEPAQSPQYLHSTLAELSTYKVDRTEYQFSQRLQKQLDRLSRQFHYDPAQSALDNEVPEGKSPQDFFQSDGQFDPRMDELIEIFKAELVELLGKQTEKCKTITNRHLNAVENKMSRILTIFEGFKSNYDNKLTAINKAIQSRQNSSQSIEYLENSIKTLAAGIHSVRNNFFDDPKFQQLFQEELDKIENKMATKISESTKSVQEEIVYFHSQLDESKKSTGITHATITNFKADVNKDLYYIKKNITALNENYALVNETLFPEYDGITETELQREHEIASAIFFVDNIKDEWPKLLSNLTLLQELHVTDIHDIITENADSKTKYEQLKESQKQLLKQINAIQDSMEKLGGSIKEVERFNLKNALEENNWISYDFQHTFGRSDCFGGKKYIRKTEYDTGAYVGVILCNATRYKIYLSEALEDTFLDIGDSGNFGEDHCEFVGADKTSVIKVDKSSHRFERIDGYYRQDWGQTPIKGRLSFFTPSPHWYECGVTIPD